MEDTLAQDPSIIGGFTIGNVPLLGSWLQDSVTKGIFDIGLFLAALISGNVILVVGKSESQYFTIIETIVFWNFICLVAAALILVSVGISQMWG